MRARWALSLVVLLVASHGEAQQEAATIDLVAHFRDGLSYYQTLHEGGQLMVELLHEEEGLVVATTRGEAAVPPAMFHLLKEILAAVGESGGNERERREVRALVVIGDNEGEVAERVVLDELPPSERRLILDVFSILHTFASEENVDLVGPRAEELLFGEGDDLWISMRWHLYFIEAGMLLLVIGLATAVIWGRKRSG